MPLGGWRLALLLGLVFATAAYYACRIYIPHASAENRQRLTRRAVLYAVALGLLVAGVTLAVS
jgi:hypothetical protein